MKKIGYLLFAILLVAGCDDNPLEAPPELTSVSARTIVGGAVVTWEVPRNDFLYINVSYKKYPDHPDTSKVVETKISPKTDSLAIKGLLNKYEYEFKVRPFTADVNDQRGGEVLETEPVQPIRRAVDTVGHVGQMIEGITPDMIDTYTQEPTGFPKDNLLDGDINTFWHSAFSSGVEPLPHWIQFNFEGETTVGAMKYYYRQTADSRGFPTQFALATSEDGEQWQRRWTSEDHLSYKPVSEQKTLIFDKNYTSKHFRVLILDNPADVSFTNLAEIDLYKGRFEIVDKEKIAEENY